MLIRLLAHVFKTQNGAFFYMRRIAIRYSGRFQHNPCMIRTPSRRGKSSECFMYEPMFTLRRADGGINAYYYRGGQVRG